MRFRFVVVLFLSLAGSACASGSFTFSHYSGLQGLVHKSVSCMYRDKDGFLWVGTTNGISRYDGYSFKNFVPDEDNARKLHGSAVHCIVENSAGTLWVLTDKGIEYFDKEQEIFHRIAIPGMRSNEQFSNICADDDGNVWAYSDHLKFVCISPLGDAYSINKIALPQMPAGMPQLAIYKFLALDGALWIASQIGIWRYDLASGAIQCISKSDLLNFCYSIRQIGTNELAAVYMREGVCLVQTDTRSSRWIDRKALPLNSGSPVLFSDVERTLDSSLWVSTLTGMYRIRGNSVECFGRESEDNYFDSDVISSLCKDRDGTLWIGTFENGLYSCAAKRNQIEIISGMHNGNRKAEMIQGIQVFGDNSALFCDANGYYFCEDYRQISAGKSVKIASASLPGIYPADGRYCLAKSNDSVFLFDSKKRTLTFKARSLGVQCTYLDKNGILWTCSWGTGLRGYDRHTGKEFSIDLDSADKSINTVYTMIGDRDGSLWLGGFGSGLIHIIKPSAQHPVVERYEHQRGTNSLSHNVIISLHDDGRGNLWVGTCGGGLNCFRKKTKRFDVFTIKQGLKSNVIESIQSDTAGNIWFASSVLSRYDVASGNFTHYSISDGVAGNFVAISGARSQSGQIFFGSTRGIVSFDPMQLSGRQYVGTPLLTSFRIHGVPVSPGDTIDGIVPYQRAVTYSRSISLPYSISSFAIEFASIQFLEAANISYEYMLEGIDRGWIPADTRTRLAAYSGLQPGTYTFRVRAGAGNGIWSKPRALTIEIVPPWWRTWWFKAMTLLSAIACIALLFFIRTRRLKHSNARLERIVSERTNELKIANESLKESALRLDQKNMILEEHQLVIEMKNKDLLDALTAKDRLISVLGHDFKNPLTSLQGAAVLLQKESEKFASDKLKRYSDIIASSSTSLMDQILMVLDWSQSQMNHLQYHPVEINIGMLIADAVNLLSENARIKNISISTQFEFETNALIDPRMMSTVLRNLLGNAIKFTPRNGKIMLQAQEYENGINVTVIDTGIGMSKELQERFLSGAESLESTFGTEKEKGSGLGLRICKLFVESNRGTITVSSTEGKGTVFSIALPKGASAIDTDTELRSTLPVSTHTGRATLLVIDDDTAVAELLRSAFEDRYSVLIATDGNEGLYMAQNMLPDLIISDIGLPGINGIDICSVLKNDELTSHIPVLILSSKSSVEVQNESYLGGAYDFIPKPFNMFALQQKVAALLQLHVQISGKAKLQAEQERSFLLPDDFENKVVKKAVAFIHDNIADTNLDINRIADSIGVSRSQLWRIFKSTTGKSVGDVIRDIRMQKAVEMLRTGKFRMSEIASEIGYSDAKYFARSFTRIYGCSPTSFLSTHDKH